MVGWTAQIKTQSGENMTDILQWPVNPARWVSEWKALGGDWINDDFRLRVMNPRIWPGMGLDEERERRMLKLSNQFNHPQGRALIRKHIEEAGL